MPLLHQNPIKEGREKIMDTSISHPKLKITAHVIKSDDNLNVSFAEINSLRA
jgi:hypothetical protein